MSTVSPVSTATFRNPGPSPTAAVPGCKRTSSLFQSLTYPCLRQDNGRMKILHSLPFFFSVSLICCPLFAQETTPEAAAPPVASTPVSVSTAPVAAPTGQPSAADMQKMMQQMMDLSKLNENHKLLAGYDGTWTYTVKMWMDPTPNAKPQESKGVATRKSIMDGRFVEMDVTGKMKMPGADGKMKEMTFKGHGTEGYDNVKKKFVGTWMDNMGTGIMMSEGDYDASSKSFTYTSEFEMMPGMKEKVREVLKLTDKDHMLLEWYEDHGGHEAKTMEISYTRKK